MALTARLQFGDNDQGLYPREYLVANCRCHFSRRYNGFRPDMDAICERVEITVIAPGMEDLSLYEWYINGTLQSGRLIYDLSGISGNDEPVTREVLFNDAYCFALAEEYNINGGNRRLLKLSIVGENITINDSKFVNLYSDNS